MKVTTPWPKAEKTTPLRRLDWFGKRRLARQGNLDGPYTQRPDDLAFEGDVTDDRWHTVVNEYDCNLVTSLLPNGQHAVTLDLDYDAQLLESRTEGHHHLYLDSRKSVSWKQYKKLLKQMAKCGLLEDGYVEASIKKGFTALRKPYGYRVRISDGTDDLSW